MLIVGGGCRGRELARQLSSAGDAVRISTRTEAGRAAIEATGAECWIGTPERLATLRGALDGVTFAGWFLGTASGPAAAVRELHDSRLSSFLQQVIDTTVRGFIYETVGTVAPAALARGERIVCELGALNAIPVAVVRADPGQLDLWLPDVRRAIEGLLIG
jgi:hypothetical protein